MEVCGDTPLEDIEWHWVGEQVGGVLYFNDEFVNMQNILDYFRCDYTPDLFWKWIENRDTIGAKEQNMESFKKLTPPNQLKQ